MTDYYGLAELLDAGGEVVDTVTVSIQTRPSTGVSQGSWGGHIYPTSFDGGDWDLVTQIRLRNGEVHEIRVVRENITTNDEGVSIRQGTIEGMGQVPDL